MELLGLVMLMLNGLAVGFYFGWQYRKNQRKK